MKCHNPRAPWHPVYHKSTVGLGEVPAHRDHVALNSPASQMGNIKGRRGWEVCW